MLSLLIEAQRCVVLFICRTTNTADHKTRRPRDRLRLVLNISSTCIAPGWATCSASVCLCATLSRHVRMLDLAALPVEVRHDSGDSLGLGEHVSISTTSSRCLCLSTLRILTPLQVFSFCVTFFGVACRCSRTWWQNCRHVRRSSSSACRSELPYGSPVFVLQTKCILELQTALVVF